MTTTLGLVTVLPGMIAAAYRASGYTLQEIAEPLGSHSATVSRRLRKSERTASMQDL